MMTKHREAAVTKTCIQTDSTRWTVGQQYTECLGGPGCCSLDLCCFTAVPAALARKQSNISLWLLGVIRSLSAQGWREHPGTPQAAGVVTPKTNKWRREKEAQTVTAGKERKTGKTGGRIIFMKCLLWARYFLRTLLFLHQPCSKGIPVPTDNRHPWLPM